jgi:hypothetical protein
MDLAPQASGEAEGEKHGESTFERFGHNFKALEGLGRPGEKGL